MKPSAERITSPLTLLRDATNWISATAALDLQPTLRALRANAQAARRSLDGDRSGQPVAARSLVDLMTALDGLEERLARLREPIGGQGPRVRFRPEQEVQTVVSMLAGSDAPALVDLDGRAPHVTGQPGLIGIATLHLLLVLGESRPRTVHVSRPRPELLRVEVSGLRSHLVDPARSIHTAVLATTVEALGGRLDLQGDRGPSFEVPLEL